MPTAYSALGMHRLSGGDQLSRQTVRLNRRQLQRINLSAYFKLACIRLCCTNLALTVMILEERRTLRGRLNGGTSRI